MVSSNFSLVACCCLPATCTDPSIVLYIGSFIYGQINPPMKHILNQIVPSDTILTRFLAFLYFRFLQNPDIILIPSTDSLPRLLLDLHYFCPASQKMPAFSCTFDELSTILHTSQIRDCHCIVILSFNTSQCVQYLFYNMLHMYTLVPFRAYHC